MRLIFSLFIILTLCANAEAASSANNECADLIKRRTLSSRFKTLQGKTSLLSFNYDELEEIEENKETYLLSNLRTVLKKYVGLKNQKNRQLRFKAALKKLYNELYLPAVLQETLLAEVDHAIEKKKPISVRRAAGDLTLSEVHIWLYGSQDGISEDSLLGRYLAESEASAYLGSLRMNSSKNTSTPKRFIVPVSEKNFRIFSKYFTNSHFLSAIGHANIFFDGSFYTFSGPKSEFRLPALNTPIPLMLMKTSEANRFDKFMHLAALAKYASWGNPLKQPWQISNYLSTTGIYHCCTHWIGNVPIGDKTTKTIVLPGQNNNPREVEISKPDYNNENKDLAAVWTYPLHQPLSAVLGLESENGTGEFASPGGVVEMLFGLANFERVPIVFVVQDDHKQSVPEDVELNYEGRH